MLNANRLAFAAALLFSTTAAAQKTTKPAPPARPAPQAAQPKALQSRVWVNFITRIYHCPGSSYYGNTRRGEYMSEAQARGLGYRAVGSRGCPGVSVTERAPLPDTTRASKRMVWVNTESNEYHCPNTAEWGLTRRGRYVMESDAAAAGQAPAGGKKCP